MRNADGSYTKAAHAVDREAAKLASKAMKKHKSLSPDDVFLIIVSAALCERALENMRQATFRTVKALKK